MAMHARPLPSRPTAGAPVLTFRPHAPPPGDPPAVASPTNGSPSSGAAAGPPETPPAGPTSPPSAPHAQPARVSAAARAPQSPSAAPSDASPDGRPWYRREPWLAWLAAALVPAIGVLAAADSVAAQAAPLRLAALAPSALCVLVAVVLLVRQGAFRSALPRPGPARAPGQVPAAGRGGGR